MQDAVLTRERFYLVGVAAVSSVVYILLTLSVVGLVLAILGYLAFVAIRATAMGFLRGNGVLATPEQFPELAREASDVARAMGMAEPPHVWVFQAGRILTAVTRRFVMGHHVVLASEIAELCWEGEAQRRALRFLLAHEFARVQRQFPLWGLLVVPGRFTPILGKAWSRASGLTFDRMAAQAQPAGVGEGLAVFAAGPAMFASVSGDRFEAQARRRGFWGWAFELVARQRPLARRMAHLDRFVGPHGARGAEVVRPPRTWSWDRILAVSLVSASIPLGVAGLFIFGPVVYDAVSERAQAAAEDFEEFMTASSCPPGMYYDPESASCYSV